jgi:type II secretory pathway pseudopilin PulG
MENLTVPLSEQSKAIIEENQKPKKKKYSFLEIAVVFSAIGVVIALALLAINPSKQGAEARNIQRQADISYILNQVSAYSKSRAGIPDEIPITQECVVYGNEICKIGPYECEDYVDLSILNKTDSDDIIQMPTDPLYISINGTGYYIYQNGEGAITTCAPYAERNKQISFTKYLY